MQDKSYPLCLGKPVVDLIAVRKEDERLWLRIYNRMFLEDVPMHYYFDFESPPWKGLPPVFPRPKSIFHVCDAARRY